MDDALEVARPIVERIVWCTVATAGSDGVPRTRLMHPVWFWDEGAPSALVTARPTPLKLRHLEATTQVSCFYWDPAHDTVAIDATAAWLEGDDRAAAWDAVKAVDPPVGFDPAMIWPDGPGSDDCRFLRFDAHRIRAIPAGKAPALWRAHGPKPER